jgi:hypothetical protein
MEIYPRQKNPLLKPLPLSVHVVKIREVNFEFKINCNNIAHNPTEDPVHPPFNSTEEDFKYTIFTIRTDYVTLPKVDSSLLSELNEPFTTTNSCYLLAMFSFVSYDPHHHITHTHTQS